MRFIFGGSAKKYWPGFYGVVAAGFALIVVVKLIFHDAPIYMLFTALVIAVSIAVGAIPGLIATAISLGAGLWLTREQAAAYQASAQLFPFLGLAAALAGARIEQVRRRGEETLRALAMREAHLMSIFDSAPEAMVVIDVNGVIQTYGASAERMFGWRPQEALGRNISALMPEPYRSQHDHYLKRYLTTGEKRIIGIGRMVVGERKDGSTFPMELAVGEVNSEQGRFFTGFVRDVTERQQNEARLQELQAEVVHISRYSAMGEMASSLAHELNQPLSAIANYLNGARRLLERGDFAKREVAEAVDKAANQALRAGDIIRRLRDFLRRGEGERSIELLGQLVHEACALALVGTKEEGVEVRYFLDPHLDRVLVDRVQIQQVIVNLVRNALDAMHGQAHRRLDVSTHVDGDMAVVGVADTGPGLDPSIAARLFQPFVSTKSQGMGIGLSISRTIIEAHGGRIWTEDNPGGGSIFRFSVRLAAQEERASAQ